MARRPSPALLSPRLRRSLLLLALLGAAVWVSFFDSHSLLRRARYFAEARTLSAENERLAGEIEALEEHVRAGLSDALVEKVAREQYGMRRPGERVYPVEERETGKERRSGR